MQACNRSDCNLMHLNNTCDITGGLFTLNKYVKAFNDLEWLNPSVARIAAAAQRGPYDGKD